MKSMVFYPDRGVGEKSSYRGNCSPRLTNDLVLLAVDGEKI